MPFKKKVDLNTGVYKSYDIRWLKQLRAEGEPHPTADYLIEEYDALVEKQPKDEIEPELEEDMPAEELLEDESEVKE